MLLGVVVAGWVLESAESVFVAVVDPAVAGLSVAGEEAVSAVSLVELNAVFASLDAVLAVVLLDSEVVSVAALVDDVELAVEVSVPAAGLVDAVEDDVVIVGSTGVMTTGVEYGDRR
ncbi:MAG TPA: hypothetical protein VN426_09210 [Syntrophomonadaceae bacterium]|nr:hypothetical protein [Syntrophomonadaceae bacterium]